MTPSLEWSSTKTYKNGDIIRYNDTYFIFFLEQRPEPNQYTTAWRYIQDGANYPTISLIGGSLLYIELNTPFTDLGCTAVDPTDGDISNLINVTGSVDPNVAGRYKLEYTVTNSSSYTASVIRTILVIPPHTNTKKPVISLIGATSMYCDINSAFLEPGYSAKSYNGFNLTNNVIVTGTIDTSITGTQTLTYSVTSHNNKTATTTRSVTINNIGYYPPWVSGHSYSSTDKVTCEGISYEAHWWTNGAISPKDSYAADNYGVWRLLTS